ncbi:MAG: tetratricopeptide repeat protein [Candidatus Altiarchaeota archaeon]
MDEVEEILGILQDGRVEEAVSKAFKSKDKKAVSECFSDFAVSLRKDNLDEFGDAEILLKAAAKLDPKSAQIRFNLGVFLSESGVLEKDSRYTNDAVVYYLEAINLDPKLVAAHYNLGLVYAYLGLFEEAEKEWETIQDIGGDKVGDYAGLRKLLDYKKVVSK